MSLKFLNVLKIMAGAAMIFSARGVAADPKFSAVMAPLHNNNETDSVVFFQEFSMAPGSFKSRGVASSEQVKEKTPFLEAIVEEQSRAAHKEVKKYYLDMISILKSTSVSSGTAGDWLNLADSYVRLADHVKETDPPAEVKEYAQKSIDALGKIPVEKRDAEFWRVKAKAHNRIAATYYFNRRQWLEGRKSAEEAVAAMEQVQGDRKTTDDWIFLARCRYLVGLTYFQDTHFESRNSLGEVVTSFTMEQMQKGEIVFVSRFNIARDHFLKAMDALDSVISRQRQNNSEYWQHRLMVAAELIDALYQINKEDKQIIEVSKQASASFDQIPSRDRTFFDWRASAQLYNRVAVHYDHAGQLSEAEAATERMVFAINQIPERHRTGHDKEMLQEGYDRLAQEADEQQDEQQATPRRAM